MTSTMQPRTPTVADKVTENRIRRMAQRQGLQLTKSRRRDPLALDFGRYRLLDDSGAEVISGDLATIERRLLRGTR
jgi:hypothetical protein